MTSRKVDVLRDAMSSRAISIVPWTAVRSSLALPR